MLGQSHVSPQLNQDSLHGVVTLPLSETGKFGWVDLSGALVDTGNVDSRDELNGGRIIGVVGAAVNVDTVYAVLMDAVRGAENSSVPVAHHVVLTISKTV